MINFPGGRAELGKTSNPIDFIIKQKVYKKLQNYPDKFDGQLPARLRK
jgi:hypothetical protein